MTSLSFISDFLRSAKARVILDPVGQARKYFTTDLIKAAPTKGPIKFDPHQVEPYKELFNEDVREVTVMAIPQGGKSWFWQVAVGVKMLNGAYRGWILYQNEDTMKEVNEYVIQPILESNPKLKRQMQKAGAIGKEKLAIDEAILLYSSLVNEPATHFVQEIYLSEVDRVSLKHEKIVKHYDAARPRVSRYDEAKESKIVTESSPDLESCISNQRFLQGSQGYWNWQCVKCGEYNLSHMLSGEYKAGEFVGGLQWSKDDNGMIVNDSIRLHCYTCNHPHVESEHSKKINLNGKYIHLHPEREEHRSFQFGALAGSGAISGSASRPWKVIVNAISSTGKRKTLEAQMALDNHYRGLPLQKRSSKESDNIVQNILKHRTGEELKEENASIVVITADTQAKHFVYSIGVVDKNMNLWIIKAGKAFNNSEMVELWENEYFGLKPELMMIDRGGHRKDDVIAIVEECGVGAYGYLGNSRASYYDDQDDRDKILFPAGKKWAFSPDDENLIFADPNPYRHELLYQLHEKTDPNEGQFIFLPSTWKDDSWQVEQIAACRPPKGFEKNRIDFSKWNSGTHDHRVDDVFDCLKMMLTLIDVAKKEANWQHKHEWGI